MKNKIVKLANEKWYVAYTDENLKNKKEETLLFLLPEKYANNIEDIHNVENIGFWIPESFVKEL